MQFSFFTACEELQFLSFSTLIDLCFFDKIQSFQNWSILSCFTALQFSQKECRSFPHRNFSRRWIKKAWKGISNLLRFNSNYMEHFVQGFLVFWSASRSRNQIPMKIMYLQILKIMNQAMSKVEITNIERKSGKIETEINPSSLRNNLHKQSMKRPLFEFRRLSKSQKSQKRMEHLIVPFYQCKINVFSFVF